MRRYIRFTIALGIGLLIAILHYIGMEKYFFWSASTLFEKKLHSDAHEIADKIDAALSEASSVLRALRENGHASCLHKERLVYARAVEQSDWISRVGVVNQTGTLLCNDLGQVRDQEEFLPPYSAEAPEISLNLPTRTNVSYHPAPVIMSLSTQNGMRLVIEIKTSALQPFVGPHSSESEHKYQIAFDNGDSWFTTRGVNYYEPPDKSRLLISEVSSEFFPVVVRVQTLQSAVKAAYKDFRGLIVISSAVFGMVCVMIAMLFARRWIAVSGTHVLDAIESRKISVVYKPIYSLKDNTPVAIDLLLHWKKPDGEIIVSQREIYEELASVGMGHYVNELAIEFSSKELNLVFQKFPELKIMSRVSIDQLKHLEFAKYLLETFAASKVRPDQIILLIAHRTAAIDTLEIQICLGQLRAKGVKVAIDQVALGTAGIAYLADIELDIVKLDSMMVDHIGNKHHHIITSGIAKMLENLGVTLYAEGVTSQNQIAALGSLGVAAAQGPLFCDALKAPQLRERLMTDFARSLSDAPEHDEETSNAQPDPETDKNSETTASDDGQQAIAV